MRTILTLIFSAMLSINSIAQDNVIDIDFKVDRNAIIYKEGIVEFISDKDTTDVSIKGTKLSIPDSFIRKNVTIIFYIDKYILRFDSIPVSVNNLYPRWTLGVDRKPFDKKKFRTVKSWRKVQIIYYLENNYGKMFTVDGCKKSKVVRK